MKKKDIENKQVPGAGEKIKRLEDSPRISTGIEGLDEILSGGLVAGRAYLARGGPGCGKTTLGTHFLATGAAKGEKVLWISLGEKEVQIRQNAGNLGFSLEGISFLDLTPSSESFSGEQGYDIFSPAEVEGEPTTRTIIEKVEKLKPARIFLDSMTQFRYLSTDSFHFRKQVLAFLRYLCEQGATVLFTSEGTEEIPDDDLQFMSDGVIHLEFLEERRRVTVSKFRGSSFHAGSHSLRLGSKGMQVFPKLLPGRVRKDFTAEPLSSGIPDLDELLHGGIERGTVTIITGPSGVGKTTLGLLFVKEAAVRGERSAVYTFEEGAPALLNRCSDINIPLKAMVANGSLIVSQVEPLQYTPDEFGQRLVREVEENSRRIVMIDSIAGFGLTMQGRDFMTNLHALGSYLRTQGVTLILINEVDHISGEFRATNDNVSYLADNVIFLRYVEANGELRKALGVLKKRSGDFEKTLREIEIGTHGVKVGKPLVGIRGVLGANLDITSGGDRTESHGK